MRPLGGEADRGLSGQVALGEEVEAFELLDGGALVGVFLKDAGDQSLKTARSMHGLREGEGALLYLLVGVLDVLGLEGRSPVNQRIDNNSHAPNIDFVAVPL